VAGDPRPLPITGDQPLHVRPLAQEGSPPPWSALGQEEPGGTGSDLLWHYPRCAALLASTRNRFPRRMAEPIQELRIEQAADYVLLHRDTGTALYRTRATEAEIHQANRNLSRSGNRNRYVAARHFGPHGERRKG
jgi:hypothetical protein